MPLIHGFDISAIGIVASGVARKSRSTSPSPHRSHPSKRSPSDTSGVCLRTLLLARYFVRFEKSDVV
jgi:hypothetical protein